MVRSVLGLLAAALPLLLVVNCGECKFCALYYFILKHHFVTILQQMMLLFSMFLMSLFVCLFCSFFFLCFFCFCVFAVAPHPSSLVCFCHVLFILLIHSLFLRNNSHFKSSFILPHSAAHHKNVQSILADVSFAERRYTKSYLTVLPRTSPHNN